MKNMIVQLFRFGIVGIVATLIDFLILYLFKEYCGFSVLLASFLAYVVSSVINYLLSTRWVFKSNVLSEHYKIIIFIIISLIGVILNELIMYFGELVSIYYMITKVISTIVLLVFNFISRKIFLEK